MAWNEPGNKNKNPWGNDKKPEGSKPEGPPELDALLAQLQQRIQKILKKKSSNGSNNGTPNMENNFTPWIIAFLIFIAAIWFLSGIFVVAPAEEAVILRFGKFVNSVGPGPHWIPRIFESVSKVDEQRIYTYSYDADMLTKDENIVSVSVAVQYRIANARQYLFNVTAPVLSLQQATASALRQVIGNTTLNDVMTSGREQVRSEVQEQLQSILGRYQTGLQITDVALQPAKAPEAVKDAFDDAIKAQEDEQRYINQARAYAMQVIPQAQGQAKGALAKAEAYKKQVVLIAEGETARYLALLPQFEQNPQVTRERLYLSTLQNVFTRTNKIFVDSMNGRNTWMYLPLDKLSAAQAQKGQEVQTPLALSDSNDLKADASTEQATPLEMDYGSDSNPYGLNKQGN